MSKKYLDGIKIEDLTGMKFGKLTVVEFDWDRFEKDEIRRGNGEIKRLIHHWLCKCECGKRISVSRSHLKSEHTSTCGMCYTFEDWCKDNNHQDWLELWDYDENGCSPNAIGYGMGKKYYFKCQREIHKSELRKINNLTSKKSHETYVASIKCRKCNSFGQYLLDTYGNLDMWSDKNTVDPFEVSRSSAKKCYIKCHICEEIKYIRIDTFLNYGIGCVKCGDGFSIPAKMFKSVLDQLGMEYKMEVTKLDFNWIGNYRYDFYIPSLNLIVEIHGMQHYKNTGFGGKALEEEQENDRLKEELALQHGFNYCVIDCRYSRLEWLKNNITEEFGKYVELLSIDWGESYKSAQSSVVKNVCEYWSSREDGESTESLGTIFGISVETIRTYLKRGTEIGWCKYDANEETRKNNSAIGKNNSKRVEVLKDNISLGIFESVAELERQSEDLLGVKLNSRNISSACLGRQKQHKGYTFRYAYYNRYIVKKIK